MRIHVGLVVILVVVSGCNGVPGVMDGTEVDSTTDEQDTLTTPQGPIGPTADTDVIGSENGYWYNATLQIFPDDGLNESERNAVISRAMARVEKIRGLEFKHNVSIEIQSRSEYEQELQSDPAVELSSAASQFYNTRYEAMFLIGENTDAYSYLQSQRGSTLLGYYLSDNIVIISDSETPILPGEETLSHELTHALQDQHFDLSEYSGPTIDEDQAMGGLIEGDAEAVTQEYMKQCGDAWRCLPSTEENRREDTIHRLSSYSYFPYDEGPGFINYHRQQGGWERVNELYSNPPQSTEQVISPERYEMDLPSSVLVTDRNTNGWSAVQPGRGLYYESIGQAGISSMFIATLFDEQNDMRVLTQQQAINHNKGEMNDTDPYNYDHSPVDGWDGDRLHIYEKSGESAYIWKSRWDSSTDAQEFAGAYRKLLIHYGATKAAAQSSTWVIDSGPYNDAFAVSVTGDTVTIVNAPTVADLSDVLGE